MGTCPSWTVCRRNSSVSVVTLLTAGVIAREDDIRKIRERMDNQIKGREREIAHTTEKIGQAQFELKKMSKKSGVSESERMQTLERKIANTDYKAKELNKEIKMLKKLQNDKA